MSSRVLTKSRHSTSQVASKQLFTMREFFDRLGTLHPMKHPHEEHPDAHGPKSIQDKQNVTPHPGSYDLGAPNLNRVDAWSKHNDRPKFSLTQEKAQSSSSSAWLRPSRTPSTRHAGFDLASSRAPRTGLRIEQDYREIGGRVALRAYLSTLPPEDPPHCMVSSLSILRIRKNSRACEKTASPMKFRSG